MICPDEVSQVDIPGSASLLAHIIIEINQKGTYFTSPLFQKK